MIELDRGLRQRSHARAKQPTGGIVAKAAIDAKGFASDEMFSQAGVAAK
ncbi:MAG: hypothetical protein ACK4K7_05785 [Allosphingosinicella sp.]